MKLQKVEQKRREIMRKSGMRPRKRRSTTLFYVPPFHICEFRKPSLHRN
jgi:hypothetical protein